MSEDHQYSLMEEECNVGNVWKGDGPIHWQQVFFLILTILGTHFAPQILYIRKFRGGGSQHLDLQLHIYVYAFL